MTELVDSEYQLNEDISKAAKNIEDEITIQRDFNKQQSRYHQLTSNECDENCGAYFFFPYSKVRLGDLF